MKTRRQIAEEFANKINSNKIKTIILYGSVARGDDHKDSDIDILIITDYWNDLEPLITELVGDIVLYEQELVSAHVMSTERYNRTKDYSFLTNVFNEGVVLVGN